MKMPIMASIALPVEKKNVSSLPVEKKKCLPHLESFFLLKIPA